MYTTLVTDKKGMEEIGCYYFENLFHSWNPPEVDSFLSNVDVKTTEA